ncbi:hypothetical protein [Streptomyces sp. NPDC088146]|uniref:hypothetical protein n=1 Tax=Streptomyces sp. NPDC088146 TaxID=3365829 RepID=UPI003823A0DC
MLGMAIGCEVRDRAVQVVKEVTQARGSHLEITEPGRCGGPMDSPVMVESEQDASAVTAEHDAGGVLSDVDGAVNGEIVEHVDGRVDEVPVIDVGQAKLSDRGVGTIRAAGISVVPSNYVASDRLSSSARRRSLLPGG